MSALPLAPGLLAALLAAGAACALLALAVAGGGPRHKARRLSSVLGKRERAREGRSDNRDERGRRKKIEDTLKEMAERQQATARQFAATDLAGKMRQAGIHWSRGRYISLCLGCGAVVLLLCLLGFGMGPLISLLCAVALGPVLPYWHVTRARARRFRTFLAELPDALDVITRGVRSGLPLGDCLQGIATEGREPLRTEFRLLVDDMGLGLSLDEALDRMVMRTPLLEVKLFAIILEIQNHAGGNLSEAIGNLSRVLRDRKRLGAKVKALSAEATASAGIIGSLPILVLGLLYITAPDYIALLFETRAGQVALGAGGLWMGIGILVMRGMIRIDV